MMGGMMGRWALLLATRDGLPSLGEKAVASPWTGSGGSGKESERLRGNFEEKSLFWLIHMDTSKICFFNTSCLIQFKLSSEAYLLFSRSLFNASRTLQLLQHVGGGYCLWAGLGCWAAWPMGTILIK